MRHRSFGRTGLKVSELGLGCMGFGPKERWFGGAGEKEAALMASKSLDAGVNLFDTADVYNIGHSESILGKALGKRRREAVVATKVFCRMGPLPNDEGLSRRHLLEACDASLRRLGTDYIDLYQVHEWDAQTPLEETLRALEDLVRSGKVRYLGASNFMGWQMARSAWVSDKAGWSRFESDQVMYNLLERGFEAEGVPCCEDLGLGVLVYSPLAGGYLTGKYAAASARGRHADAASSYPSFDRRRGEAAVKVLSKLAAAYGKPPAQVALAWILARPWVSSVLVGATSAAQLDDTLAASELRLGQDALTLLDRLSAI